MELAILSSHRKIKPHGIQGGENGQLGKNYIIRKNKNNVINLNNKIRLFYTIDL